MFQAVIFDWDGTIANTKNVVVQSFQKVLRDTNCEVSNNFIERRIGIGTKRTLKEAYRFCNQRIDIQTLEKLSEEKITIQAELSDEVNLLPEYKNGESIFKYMNLMTNIGFLVRL